MTETPTASRPRIWSRSWSHLIAPTRIGALNRWERKNAPVAAPPDVAGGAPSARDIWSAYRRRVIIADDDTPAIVTAGLIWLGAIVSAIGVTAAGVAMGTERADWQRARYSK